MTDVVVLLSTCGSAEEAERIAQRLVGGHVAACVNILPGVRSVYRWMGQVEAADEWLLVIKTLRQRRDDVAAALREVHSYEVPELVELPVTGGGASYLQWVAENASAPHDDPPPVPAPS